MWKILKKILRTIALWLPLCCMIINAYAIDDIETIPLHQYISFRWGNENSTTAKILSFDTQNKNMVGGTLSYRGIVGYQSALQKNTFYHLQIEVTSSNAAGNQWISEQATGMITSSGGEISTILFPANTLSPYLQIIDESAKQFEEKTIEWSYSSMRTQNITSYVGAKAYYYFTRKDDTTVIIDSVFYFNDEFFNYGWSYDASSTRYMQCYLGIVLPMTGGFKMKKMEVYPVGGSDYTGKLDEIISLLQSQGGGLSREEIEAATLAALQQHDAAEEQKANNKIQQIKQQIESITEPYKENLTSLQDATRSITASLNYSGTTAVLKLPEARNPMTNNSLLWEEKEIDLGYYWEQLPQALRSAITIILTFLILYKVIIEMVDEITWVIYMDKNVDKAERNAIGL